MKFIVEVPDDVFEWAKAEGVNRQMVAKFMREELRNVGTRYGGITDLYEVGPGYSHEWRGWIFDDVRVVAQKSASPPLGGIDAATHGR